MGVVTVSVASETSSHGAASLCVVDGGGSVLGAIKEYTGIHAGRMSPLPSWAYKGGALLGIEGGTDYVNATLRRLWKANVPIAGVWMQDWTGQRDPIIGKMVWYNWVLDKERYPRWQELVASIKAHGGRVLTYVNSFLSDRPEVSTQGHTETHSILSLLNRIVGG